MYRILTERHTAEGARNVEHFIAATPHIRSLKLRLDRRVVVGRRSRWMHTDQYIFTIEQ